MSVVVPATNAPPTLARCMDAIRRADDRPDELVVVEDHGLTASEARNAGAARATGEVIVFVDADVEVHPDAFGRIRRAFTEDPSLTAVFGSYDDAPADRGLVSAFRNLLHHHVHHTGAGPADTFWTGLGAVRRLPFLAIGGFDEVQYRHPSIEDIELGARMRASGATIELDPGIQGKHLKVWTLRSMVWTDFVRRGVPWIRLQLRNRRPANTLNCGWRHRLSAAAMVLVVLGAVLWLPALVAGGVGGLVGLNRAFYLVLLQRMGPVHALAGVGLHGLHHLVAIAAVPAGIGWALYSWLSQADTAVAAPMVDGAGAE